MSTNSSSNLAPQGDKSNTVAHTPGPWVTDIAGELDHPGQHPGVYGPDKIIASVGNMEPWTEVWQEWHANARLIAASPLMIEYIMKRAAEGDAEASKIVEVAIAPR